eukprot:2067730-Prymnesium_polylepis.1
MGGVGGRSRPCRAPSLPWRGAACAPSCLRCTGESASPYMLMSWATWSARVLDCRSANIGGVPCSAVPTPCSARPPSVFPAGPLRGGWLRRWTGAFASIAI